MKSLMADFEYLSFKDDAAIIQIGAVVFDERYEIIDTFLTEVSALDGIYAGFRVDQDVAVWWGKRFKQDKNINLYSSNISCIDAAEKFDKFLVDTFNNESFALYVNGLLNDIPKIDNFLSRYRLKTIQERIPYNLIYDYRSIRDFISKNFPNAFKNFKDELDEKYADFCHDAYSDCKYQVEMLKFCNDQVAPKFK